MIEEWAEDLKSNEENGNRPQQRYLKLSLNNAGNILIKVCQFSSIQEFYHGYNYDQHLDHCFLCYF